MLYTNKRAYCFVGRLKGLDVFQMAKLEEWGGGNTVVIERASFTNVDYAFGQSLLKGIHIKSCIEMLCVVV